MRAIIPRCVTHFGRPSAIVALATALLACSGGRTEILIEVGSDLLVPDQIDTITIEATDPDGRTQTSNARLGPGEVRLPRTLGMVYEEGPLGPYRVVVAGARGDARVVERVGELTFVRDRIVVWRVDLVEECLARTCEAGETCTRGGCRPEEVGAGELSAWDGVAPPQDAGSYDACVPTERCNGVDDDCDGATDEGFDLVSDPANCGACGVSCDVANASATCTSGACVITTCEAGFGDCDGVASNGCETDTTTSAAHCGACGAACTPPNRACCAATCAREC